MARKVPAPQDAKEASNDPAPRVDSDLEAKSEVTVNGGHSQPPRPPVRRRSGEDGDGDDRRRPRSRTASFRAEDIQQIPPYSPPNANRSLSSSFSSSSGASTPSPRSRGSTTGAIPRSGATRESFSSRHGLEIEAARAAAVANARRRQRRHLDSLNLDPPSVPTASLPTTEDTTDYVSSAISYLHHWTTSDEPQPVQEIENEGQELYLHFFHEQLRGEGLSEAAIEDEMRLLDLHDHSAHIEEACDEVGAAAEGACAVATRRQRRISMNLNNFQNPAWRQAGRDLQSLADAFARSQERTMVRQRAATVDLSSLNMENFMKLLRNLFEDGNNVQHRILVLFFFCSDLAIMAVKYKMDGLLSNLTKWTLMFIKDKVCQWVHNNGGWPTVLRSGLNVVQQLAMIGCFSAITVACILYVRKNLRS